MFVGLTSASGREKRIVAARNLGQRHCRIRHNDVDLLRKCFLEARVGMRHALSQIAVASLRGGYG